MSLLPPRVRAARHICFSGLLPFLDQSMRWTQPPTGAKKSLTATAATAYSQAVALKQLHSHGLWQPRFSPTGFYPQCSAIARKPKSRAFAGGALWIKSLTFADLAEARSWKIG